MSQGATIEAMEITGVTADSRMVKPGFLFAALPGSRVDGRDFIADAVARGAACVLAPPGVEADTVDAPLVTSENPRRLFAIMAARLHERQPEHVAAVTGTNGKTSVAIFLRQIWTALGRSAASVGTLGVSAPDFEVPGSLTTPDPVTLHETLAELETRGVERVAMEASSHGLDQHRLDGVHLAAAAFTNLSRDHLDYHGDMDAYLAAKERLFTDVMAPGGYAVLNADAPEFPRLRARCARRGHQMVSFGLRKGDIHCVSMIPSPSGWGLELSVHGRVYKVSLPLIGRFQVSNALCALGLALAGEPAEARAVAALARLQGAKGRLQKVTENAYVDYAHTPDALDTVLRELRGHVKGRLSVAFGCGGDRDPGKREMMGRVADALADDIIVTDDNPRTEDPGEIRRQTMAGCPRGREIGDRAEAIAVAVRSLGEGDLLVVAGKGHEQGQIVGEETTPFDDAEEILKAAREKGA